MTLPVRLCLIFFPVLYGLLATLFGQDANWDLRNYHWYNAYAFLNGRFGFDLLPSQTPFFYNPILDLPLYLTAQHFSAELTTFLLGLAQGLNFVLLFTLARRVMRDVPGRDFDAICVAFIGVCGGGVLGELGTSFYDNIVSIGVLAGMSILVLRLQQSEDRADFKVAAWKWFIAGIPFGLVTGFKLPTAVFAAGCGLALVLYPAPFKERLRRGFFCALGMGVGLAVALGPWAVYLWQDYQNPLFPYFNDTFLSPLAPATSARDTNFLPHGLQYLYFPFAWTLDPLKVGEVFWRDLKLPLVYALLPIALLLFRFQNRGTYNTANDLTNRRRAYILLAGALSYAAWLFMFSIYRYAVPLELLSGLLLYITLDLLRFNAARKREIFMGLIFILLSSMRVADWGHKPLGEHYVMVTPPAIENPGDAMLLMVGFQPYSHIIPAFPPQMPVVRIQSNFASPEENKGINGLIRSRVADHKGAFYIVAPTYDIPWTDKQVLPQFGLKTVLENCQILKNNIAEDMSLCPVTRLK